MVRAIKQTVRIQPGGRLELVSKELPDGAEAEVIVLLDGEKAPSHDCWGLFADEPDLMEQVVADAMARETPFRNSHA